jgi:hypothetical protein
MSAVGSVGAPMLSSASPPAPAHAMPTSRRLRGALGSQEPAPLVTAARAMPERAVSPDLASAEGDLASPSALDEFGRRIAVLDSLTGRSTTGRALSQPGLAGARRLGRTRRPIRRSRGHSRHITYAGKARQPWLHRSAALAEPLNSGELRAFRRGGLGARLRRPGALWAWSELRLLSPQVSSLRPWSCRKPHCSSGSPWMDNLLRNHS